MTSNNEIVDGFADDAAESIGRVNKQWKVPLPGGRRIARFRSTHGKQVTTGGTRLFKEPQGE